MSWAAKWISQIGADGYENKGCGLFDSNLNLVQGLSCVQVLGRKIRPIVAGRAVLDGNVIYH